MKKKKKKTPKKKTRGKSKPVGSVLITSGGLPYRVVEQRMDDEITYLSPSDYRALIRLMEVCGHETDNDGQIIIYTDHAFDQDDRVVAVDWIQNEEE